MKGRTPTNETLGLDESRFIGPQVNEAPPASPRGLNLSKVECATFSGAAKVRVFRDGDEVAQVSRFAHSYPARRCRVSDEVLLLGLQ